MRLENSTTCRCAALTAQSRATINYPFSRKNPLSPLPWRACTAIAVSTAAPRPYPLLAASAEVICRRGPSPSDRPAYDDGTRRAYPLRRCMVKCIYCRLCWGECPVDAIVEGRRLRDTPPKRAGKAFARQGATTVTAIVGSARSPRTSRSTRPASAETWRQALQRPWTEGVRAWPPQEEGAVLKPGRRTAALDRRRP